MTIRRPFSMPRELLAGFVVAVLLAVALLVTPSPVKALPGGDCTDHVGQMASPIRFKGYEGAAFTGHVLCVHVTGAIGFDGHIGLSNMKNYPFDGWCQWQGPASVGTWNDCFNSFKWELGCRQRLRVYFDSGYVNQWGFQMEGQGQKSPLVDAFGDFNDKLSSLRITEDVAC